MRLEFNGGFNVMARLAYNIRTAAEAASVSEHAIKVAVREGELPTRVVNGVRVILHTDMHAWMRAGEPD